jgi:hypothetical protein
VPSRSVCRPKRHLDAAAKLYPRAWKLIDAMRADRGRGLPAWPEWCFAPLAVSAEVVNEGDSQAEALVRVVDMGRLPLRSGGLRSRAFDSAQRRSAM